MHIPKAPDTFVQLSDAFGQICDNLGRIYDKFGQISIYYICATFKL